MSEYPENTMFPPDFKKYGTKHNGYKNGDYEVILYDFAAVGCDLELPTWARHIISRTI